MSSLIVRWSWRTAILAASLVLSACVISASGVYFNADDFVVPKVFTGDWTLVPNEGTDKTEDVMTIRVSPIAGDMHRALPLDAKGVVEKDEEPLDFGLVDLGSGKYLLVNVEDEGDAQKSNFIGVDAQEDKLTFYFFSGGETDAGEAVYTQALAQFGFTRDVTHQYEVRLSGDVTKDKIKDLFKLLMANPAPYEPNINVYKKLGPRSP